MIKMTTLGLILTAPYLVAKDQENTKWHKKADHGPAFFQTFGDWYKGKLRRESAIKGIALSYSEDREKIALFNTETLSLISASNGGLRLLNTPWAGAHGDINRFNNENDHLFTAAEGPAWAAPDGSFEDTRTIPGYGNFTHLKFLGSYRHGHQVILDYSVNDTRVLDSLRDHENGLIRHLEIAPHSAPLTLRLLNSTSYSDFTLKISHNSATLSKEGDTHLLTIPASSETVNLAIHYSTTPNPPAPVAIPLTPLTKGGPGISPETFQVTPQLDSSKNPWLVDQIPLPPSLEKSPYHQKNRICDFDFFSDQNRALLTTWDGDIWHLSGLKDFKTLTWKRYATGFFEPLGLKIVNDTPHIAGRDGIYQIFDLNHDGEADHRKVFNYDIYLTNNFHEFQFGLETDSAGNFYFAKSSPVKAGGRGFDKILPHNGAFLKLTPDGKTLTTIATGLRAPGGIGIGPNGEFTTGENEGTWQPCCKINFALSSDKKPFFGVEDTRHDNPTPFTEPLCYLPMSVDNSGGSQLWVPENNKLGIAPGELLHLSYGKSSIYHVLRQTVGENTHQGGVVKLPVKLSSSAQRGTFHPDGTLYISGFRGWQTNAATEAGLQRIRQNTSLENPLPHDLKVTKTGITLTFATPLDPELAADPTSYTAERWKYIRSKQYGSGHFSVDNPNKIAEKIAAQKSSRDHRAHDPVKILQATLSPDQKTVTLTLENHKPSQQFKLDYDLESTTGTLLIGTLHSTIHKIPN